MTDGLDGIMKRVEEGTATRADMLWLELQVFELRQRVAELELALGWVPIEERKPPEGCWVLASVFERDLDGVPVAQLRPAEWTRQFGWLVGSCAPTAFLSDGERVTHWCPLPAVPLSAVRGVFGGDCTEASGSIEALGSGVPA